MNSGSFIAKGRERHHILPLVIVTYVPRNDRNNRTKEGMFYNMN